MDIFKGTPPMPFPESRRVIYQKNPLDLVVCQLRFPTILRVDAEPPAAFQEQIRGIFPLYGKEALPLVGLPPLPPQLLSAFGTPMAHTFRSADNDWTLTLTRDFLALSTKKYLQWADFKSRLGAPLTALLEIYKPSFFQRIGLRYRDRIAREEIGLADEAWPQLLESRFLGELADENVGPKIEQILRELLIVLDGKAGKVRVVHGLQEQAGGKSYIIDSDFFNETQTDLDEVWNVLEGFNRRAGHLFRWYITGKLHDAMQPRNP
jgi:uncharacterized protein (TIGR04255 family)